jgi:general secretion pathway protein G
LVRSEIPTPKSKIQNPKSSRGFTLLELIIVICIVSILAGLFLVRVPFYQEQAEKTAMEQVRGAVQSALVLRYGAMMTRGATGEKELNALSSDNPLGWLQQKPENYAGEFFDPAPGAIPSGQWFFDLKTHDLVYIPNRSEYLKAGKDGRKWLRFHVRLEYEPRLGGGNGKELTSTLFEPVEPYQWFQ